MKKPAVVVAIVSYKSADLTTRCLHSLSLEREASSSSIDVIVVDNASGDYPHLSRVVTDNGWTSWVTLIDAPRNGGFGYGNNIAIRRALGTAAPTYIHLLNPDTELRAGAISALVDFMECHPRVGIAGSSFENLDGSNWPIAFRFPSLKSELCQGLDVGLISRVFEHWLVPRVMPSIPNPTDWVSGASMMVRATVFAAIGGFDESYFLYFEETDFSYRAMQAGFPTWYVPQSRVMHISGYSTHVTSATAQRRRFPAYWFESRRRYFANTHGLPKAKLVDMVAIIASSLGWIKKTISRQNDRIVPHLVRDLWHYSVLRRRNQVTASAMTSLEV